MNELDQLAEVKVLTLAPFQRQVKTCPKCGHGPTRVPGIFVRWFDLPHAAFAVGYCPGSQDPQKEIKFALPDRDVSRMVDIVCASVRQEHLHVTCTHCKHHFLMETMDQRK